MQCAPARAGPQARARRGARCGGAQRSRLDLRKAQFGSALAWARLGGLALIPARVGWIAVFEIGRLPRPVGVICVAEALR
jgi:hypothetical protein